MKHLVCSLFPVPCSLLLFAATDIYSTKIDTFQRVPEWFPTSVDRWHTFGSAGHTNCILWTSLDTLAAVESVFDAYHERAFYASEGCSNTWDAAVYGPRLSQAEPPQLWFTNTLDRIPKCFVYRSWTNDEYAVSNAFCRGTPESRRLVEFDNVFALAKWLPSLVARTRGAPYLDKGDTWGHHRDIMFGSSWGPCTTELPAFDWTNGDSLPFNPATNCVPLCYCARDTVFNPHSTTNSFLWDVMRTLDNGFHALYRIEGGPEVAYYPVRTNGYLAAWEGVGEKQTVPGIITNLFPHAGPEIGLTRLTRRLVPDDYEAAHFKTSYWETVRSKPFTFDLSRIRKNGDLKSGTKNMSCRFSEVLQGDWSSSGWWGDVVSLPAGGYSEDSVGIYSRSADPDFIGYPNEGERMVVRVLGPIQEGYWQQTSYDPPSGVVRWRWDNSPPIGHFVADFQRFVSETDVVEYASSVLATESRALAMLDRTYEIPTAVAVRPAEATGDARDVETRYRSSLIKRGGLSREMTLKEKDTFPSPITYAEMLGSRPEIVEYSRTNVYSAVGSQRARMRLYDLSDAATGTCGASAPFYKQPIIGVYLRVALGGTPQLREGVWYHVTTYANLINDEFFKGCRVEASLTDDDATTPPITVSVFEFNLASLIPKGPVEVTFDATLSINRSAKVFVGGIHPLSTYDRMYPWRGPGAWGYADGVVGKSRILFVEEMLRFVARPRQWFETDVQWLPEEPVSLPYSATAQEIAERRFTWGSQVRMAVSTSMGGLGNFPNRIRDEQYALRQGVSLFFRDAVGDMGSAQALIPVSSSQADGLSDAGISGYEIVPWVDSVTGPPMFFRRQNGQDELRYDVGGEPGSEVGNGDYLHLFSPSMHALASDGHEITFRDSYRRVPVAVDGDLRPVIVTDWNWKALKAERTNP